MSTSPGRFPGGGARRKLTAMTTMYLKFPEAVSDKTSERESKGWETKVRTEV